MSRRLLILVAFAAVAPAHAQPATDSAPWARGVSEENKQRAHALLEQGNQLLLASKLKEAVAIYEQALAAWDHPAIRFNLVRALIGLDKPLEAAEQLEKALAFGAAPLEDQVYGEALNYQRLLRGQIATVAITCDQPGVALALDGTEAVTCPGSREVRVLPGTHRLVGTGRGLMTASQELIVTGGSTTPATLRLYPLVEGERRWASWQPWTIAGSGAVVLGVGIAFNLMARSARSELEEQTALRCNVRGCSPEDYRALGLADLEDRVRTRNTISMITLGIGGAAAITGGVMILLNRAPLRRQERITLIAPRGGVGLAVTGSF